MPPKIRDMIGGKDFILFRMPKENCIRIYRPEEWEENTNKLFVDDGVDRTELQRRVFLNSENCELDAQSRFVMPTRFIEKAGIKRDIIVIGIGKRAEIWAKEKYVEKYGNDEEIEEALPITFPN
jgi:MraZ protein